VSELKTIVAKKSNIKDVCALLDMKSSKQSAGLTFLTSSLDIDDVNKAFEEMHSEVERKISKQDYELAMGD